MTVTLPYTCTLELQSKSPPTYRSASIPVMVQALVKDTDPEEYTARVKVPLTGVPVSGGGVVSMTRASQLAVAGLVWDTPRLTESTQMGSSAASWLPPGAQPATHQAVPVL